MSSLAYILLHLMLARTAHSDPFDQYLNSVKAHRLAPDFAGFARSCKLEPAGKRPVRGVNPGALWIPARDIVKAVHDTESDYFSSAEIWMQDDGPRIIVLWSLSFDVGSEVRTMGCLDEQGKPANLQVTNWSVPVDGSAGGWTHQLYEKLDHDGKVISKRGLFVNLRGEQMPKPKLTEDEEGSFDWVPERSVIFNIESQLGGFKVGKTERRDRD